MHVQTLRHSAASFLLAAGTHTEVVKSTRDWSDAIAAITCSHVAPTPARRSDRLDEAIRW